MALRANSASLVSKLSDSWSLVSKLFASHGTFLRKVTLPPFRGERAGVFGVAGTRKWSLEHVFHYFSAGNSMGINGLQVFLRVPLRAICTIPPIDYNYQHTRTRDKS